MQNLETQLFWAEQISPLRQINLLTVKRFVGFLVLGLYSLLSFDSALLNFLIALDFFVSSIAIKIIFGSTAACAVD